MTHQSGILAPVAPLSRFMEFQAAPDADVTSALKALAALEVDDSLVIGFGEPLIKGLGKTMDGLTSHPAVTGPGVTVPSTQADLWVALRGEDRGDLVHRSRAIRALVEDAFETVLMVDGFMYRDSRDLSGYIDGTENPEGDEALEAAIAADGSSFVAVQQWVHDLDHFQSLPGAEQDDIFGRHVADNEEFDEAPISAHVKRTAQESFSPEAFMLRRSTPWADDTGEGLVFIAFGHSFDAYAAVLNRMTGGEDGVTDALFRFTRPITGSFFWCPPVKDGKLDLSGIGI